MMRMQTSKVLSLIDMEGARLFLFAHRGVVNHAHLL